MNAEQDLIASSYLLERQPGSSLPEQLLELVARWSSQSLVIDAAINGEIVTHPISAASDWRGVAAQALSASAGSLAVRDIDERDCRAFAIWPGGGLPCNVGLELPRAVVLARTEEAVESYRLIAATFKAFYLHVRARGEEEGVPPGQLGLEAGLLNVYWINIFSGPFFRWLGERVMRVQRSRTELVASEGILLRLGEKPPIARSEEWHKLQEEVRRSLGLEYFVDQEALQDYLDQRDQPQQEGVVGLGFLFQVLRASRRAKNLEERFWARKRPMF